MSLIKNIPSYILNQCDFQNISNVSRVTGEEKDLYIILNERGLFQLKKKSTLNLKVGDWIVYDEQLGIVLDSFSPINSLQRLKGGGDQIIANNTDHLWIVTSANSDLNLNRIERYLQMAINAGVEARLILTKIDLIAKDDLESIVNNLNSQFKNLKITPISIKDNLNCDEILNNIPAKETIALMGSSGVGKSTLINFIRNNNDIKTQETRQDDKGRHTTTNRRLFMLDNGCFIIDNPGIRGVSVALPYLEKKYSCKFSDCSHTGEPGCELQRLIDRGDLNIRSFENMQKMKRESEYFLSKDNFFVRKERLKKWKNISKDARVKRAIARA